MHRGYISRRSSAVLQSTGHSGGHLTARRSDSTASTTARCRCSLSIRHLPTLQLRLHSRRALALPTSPSAVRSARHAILRQARQILRCVSESLIFQASVSAALCAVRLWNFLLYGRISIQLWTSISVFLSGDRIHRSSSLHVCHVFRIPSTFML